MSSPVIPCAFADEPGEHTGGIYGSPFGPICLGCYRTRQNRGLEGPDTEPTKAGVVSDKAFQARGSDDVPLEETQPWWWRPFDRFDERGQLAQQDSPIHARRARDGRARGKGRPIARTEKLVTIEQLAAKHLTPDQWAVVYLQLQGKSYASIADDLGLEVVTVRERLRRAREKLRQVQSA